MRDNEAGTIVEAHPEKVNYEKVPVAVPGPAGVGLQ
jgi:hypothetical protein